MNPVFRNGALAVVAFSAVAALTASQVLSPLGAEAASKPQSLFDPGVISDVAERVSPAVVSITTRSVVERGRRSSRDVPEGFFRFGPGLPTPSPRGPEMGVASGVIISADGYIVTNNHVVEHAGDIRVRFSDGRDLPAKLIGTDAPSDLALIKVEASSLPFLRFGDSGKLRLGEFVLAVGNPFGVGQTVTMGIVSAKGRSNMGIVDYEDFIQTDAAINPGNSGGALVNLDGTLVGVNTAIVSRTGGAAGIGFAVPSDMAQPIVEQIRGEGRVRRGWLGVAIQDLTPELARALESQEERGVVISDVLGGGPADKGGLKAGDVVLSIDERPVRSASELRNLIAMFKPSARTEIKVRRGNEIKNLTVKLDEKKDEQNVAAAGPAGREGPGDWEGVELEALTPALRQRLEAPRSVEGIVVTDLDPDSAAARSGLRLGDVIVSADKQPVRSIRDLTKIAKEGDETLLRVWRGGSYIFVVVGGER